ncbi:hypothetical protein LUZ60_003353 [Juncus effusus]|nr:hypothetical protein LUZ60_003353 [Juncus effusus]
MHLSQFLFVFFFFFLSFTLAISASESSSNFCSSSSQPDPKTLIQDRLTVLISGHSPHRLPLLRQLVLSLSAHPVVHSIFILWSNPSVSPSQHLPLSSPFISLVNLPSPSLNLRFLPFVSIRTRAVAISDDDISIPPPSLSFAFSLWQASSASLVGFFPRSHDLDISRREWMYTVHPDRFSILLTKFMILNKDYLFKYTCSEKYAKARSFVDKERNCEDILMNFVVSMEGGSLPVLVDSGGVRDYGDPRNRAEPQNTTKSIGEEGEVKKAGLSSRGEKHWKKRGECIREFHKLLGEMPLRYSHGKMVQGIKEPALCRKAGKIVPCDQQDL